MAKMKDSDIEIIEKGKEIIKAQIMLIQTLAPDEHFDELTGAGIQLMRAINTILNSNKEAP